VVAGAAPASAFGSAGVGLYPGRMAYTRDERRFIAGLVCVAFAAMLLLHACEESMRYHGPTIDDGGDAAAENEER